MQVKSNAECSPLEHSALILMCIKLPPGFKTFVFLSIIEWLLETDYTVIYLISGVVY